MTRGVKLLVGGGIAVALVSLVAYYKQQFDKLAKFCYTYAGGMIHTFNLDNVKITILFKVKNRSDISVNISNLVFNIYINNMYVTTIKRKDRQKLMSNGYTIIKLDFEFIPKDLLRAGVQNIQQIVFDKEALNIRIDGTLSAGAGIVAINDYKFSQSISLKELLAPNPTTDRC